MKDLCIPVPNFSEKEEVFVEVSIGNIKSAYNFKVVSFPWEEEMNGNNEDIMDSFFKINRLKTALNSYDKNWELIQIFTPPKNANYIQVLYRKRK